MTHVRMKRGVAPIPQVFRALLLAILMICGAATAQTRPGTALTDTVEKGTLDALRDIESGPGSPAAAPRAATGPTRPAGSARPIPSADAGSGPRTWDGWLGLVRLFAPALITAVAVGIACAVSGVFVLLRREALLALALPQVVAVGAAVSNEKNELLLIQRADSGVWLYPTGWCDVGYSAAEVVVKEVLEETGIEVEPIRLIGVLDGMRLGSSRIPLYSLLFFCRVVGGAMNIHPLECSDAGWFARDSLPSPTIGAERWAGPIFDAIDGTRTDVFYDDLRRPVWRGEP